MFVYRSLEKGFKATMVYEHCLTERNATLFNIFGQLDKIPDEIPATGTLLNITTGNGTLDSLIMPELPECDLEKELDNVSFPPTVVLSFI